MHQDSPQELSAGRGTVFVVDQDAGIRSSLTELFLHLPVRVETFRTAEEFLAKAAMVAPACVIADVALPGMSGIELQKRLLALHDPPFPIIFIATQGDIPTAVCALRLGALDFIEKPVIGRYLLHLVSGALRTSATNGDRA